MAWRRWATIGVALGIISALVPVVLGKKVGTLDLTDPLGRLAANPGVEPAGPTLDGLNLLRLEMHPRRVTSPLRHGLTAELTLDPDLQRSAQSVMKRYQLPEAGAVLMDVKTGDVLVYASHVSEGVPFDVNVRAEAPAASVFKVVTAAALLDQPGMSAQTEQCYRGGRSRILENELRDDPERDRWCSSLAMAMGRSINVVFARLARKHLTPESLTTAAGAFGFGAPIPFDVPAEAPGVEIPSDPLEFARAAAGFWHTTLSPLAAASLVQAVANDGLALRPRIVRKVLDGDLPEWTVNDKPTTLRRAIPPQSAHELTKMMMQTVASGSAFKTFHDSKRAPYLPNIRVAGKTGTLTRHKQNRHYTWFVGFAPADKPEVAVSALVVNTPVWRIKGPHLAREVLRAYFAKRGYPGVSRP
jgi:cell division protein FtsI/penicillin-binding protein 2